MFSIGNTDHVTTNPSELTDATLGAILGALLSFIIVFGAITVCTILVVLLVKRKGMTINCLMSIAVKCNSIIYCRFKEFRQ